MVVSPTAFKGKKNEICLTECFPIRIPSFEAACLYLEIEQWATDNSGHTAFDR
jgi:hypothetical protein